jgi:hypothetical protein
MVNENLDEKVAKKIDEITIPMFEQLILTILPEVPTPYYNPDGCEKYTKRWKSKITALKDMDLPSKLKAMEQMRKEAMQERTDSMIMLTDSANLHELFMKEVSKTSKLYAKKKL